MVLLIGEGWAILLVGAGGVVDKSRLGHTCRCRRCCSYRTEDSVFIEAVGVTRDVLVGAGNGFLGGAEDVALAGAGGGAKIKRGGESVRRQRSFYKGTGGDK